MDNNLPKYTEEDILKEFSKMKTYQKNEINNFRISLFKSFIVSICFSLITLFLFKNSETGKLLFNIYDFYYSSFIYTIFISLFFLFITYIDDLCKGGNILRTSPTVNNPPLKQRAS